MQPSQGAAQHPLCRRATGLRRHRSKRRGHNQRTGPFRIRPGLSSGIGNTTADVAAAADINLGLGAGILGSTDGGLAAVVDIDLGLDTSGNLDDANVDIDACVIIGGGTDGCGTPGTETPGTDTTDPGTGTTGTTDPGTGTTGTTGGGTTGITVVPAGTSTGSVSSAATTMGNTSGQGGTATLAKTGMDASLIPLALILLLAGLLMLKPRRKA
ncbi:hypothetical protein [Pseudarthrobacter cellobiosi]|uniref:hypothetical protein n=1 Tax=Pseudarthrobacter cellobiosi TaxID=2953654 RepID=UPI00208DE673|nr:hypothetical protein [Pseudarthrobacter sp. HLT1-5]MCO4254579.1 hypothetical protein [Pseudarthrobacter sp. HLT1-5]